METGRRWRLVERRPAPKALWVRERKRRKPQVLRVVCLTTLVPGGCPFPRTKGGRRSKERLWKG